MFVRDSDSGGVRSDIFVVEADGSSLRRLTRTRGASAPAWSPNGKKIAFIRTVGPWDLVYVMRSDGTNVKKLTPSGHNSGVDWLSNDRVVYYNADEDRSWSIDAGGAEKRRAFRDRRGALSPDGKWIAFDTPGQRIWVAHANGTDRRLVTRKVCCIYLDIRWAPK